MKRLRIKFLNWLYYLDCETEQEKKAKHKCDIEMAIWQLNIFTR